MENLRTTHLHLHLVVVLVALDDALDTVVVVDDKGTMRVLSAAHGQELASSSVPPHARLLDVTADGKTALLSTDGQLQLVPIPRARTP